MIKNVLKLKELKERIKVIPDAIIKAAFENTTNIRDLFLLSLLFESGLRIGEALSLYKVDIIFDLVDGHHIHSTGQPINFSRVAKQAGLGKSTLYSIPEVKELIIAYRKQSLQKSYKQADRTKTDSMIRSLKRKIFTLETENKALKEQIKRMYGEIFEVTTQK